MSSRSTLLAPVGEAQVIGISNLFGFQKDPRVGQETGGGGVEEGADVIRKGEYE